MYEFLGVIISVAFSLSSVEASNHCSSYSCFKNCIRSPASERKAVRDHAKAKGKTTMEDGVKVTKYPYMGEAGETVAKRPRPKRRLDQYNKGGMLKKPTNP